MGALRISKQKDHVVIVQGSKNANSKENQIVKEKKPKSDNHEDEDSKLTDEGLNSMKKFKKKGITSKCYYGRNGFLLENKCFKNNMEIMSQLLEKHNNEIPDELEKPVESSEHYHSA